MTWWAILAACAACYAVKVIGVSVPARVLADRRIAHAAGLLPIGLLAALVATQTFTSGHHLALDARAAGLAVAVAAQARRAPFVVVVAAAVATTAVVRALA